MAGMMDKPIVGVHHMVRSSLFSSIRITNLSSREASARITAPPH
jgi:hypothetical protein